MSIKRDEMIFPMRKLMKRKKPPPPICGKWASSNCSPRRKKKVQQGHPPGIRRHHRAIRKDASGSGEIQFLTERIALWEKRDPTLKPKKQHLNFMRYNVSAPPRNITDIPELKELN